MGTDNCDPVWLTTMSSIGSMTSAFNPESRCLKDLYLDNDKGNLYLNPQMDAKCFPPNFPENADNQVENFYYYSPAICPSGYTSACDETCLVKPIPMSETAMRCCPVGYTCVKDFNWCTSPVTSATEATLTNQQKVTTVPASSSRKAYALAIYARHQSTDLELFASATEGATTSEHTAENTGGTSGDTSSGDTNSEETGLSSTAKIAIGVSVPVVIIVIALVIFWLCWKKRSKSKDELHQPSGPWVKPELDSTEVELTEQTKYDAKGPVKMPPNMYELPDNGVYYEMDGQQTGWPPNR